jgi:prevent-host-death family protein
VQLRVSKKSAWLISRFNESAEQTSARYRRLLFVDGKGEMSLSLLGDVRSATDLRRNTLEILQQIHETGRPVIVTVNGKADAVLLDIRIYEEHLTAFKLARLLVEGEGDIAAGRVRAARIVFREFRNSPRCARKVLGKKLR